MRLVAGIIARGCFSSADSVFYLGIALSYHQQNLRLLLLEAFGMPGRDSMQKNRENREGSGCRRNPQTGSQNMHRGTLGGTTSERFCNMLAKGGTRVAKKYEYFLWVLVSEE